MCIAQLYALPHQCKRSLGLVDEFGSLFYRLIIQLRIRIIRPHIADLRLFPFARMRLRILRKVEHHGAGTSRACNIEGLTDGPRYILRATYLIGPLGDGLRHTHKVYFLKGIRAQRTDAHLPGNHNDGR